MTDSDLQQLFIDFSAGRTPDKQDFNASRMFSLLEDPFSIWCSFHAPQEEAVPETNRYENLKIRTDRRSRDEWIKEKFPNVVFISGETDADRFKNTLSAMASGAEAIANCALWNLPESVYGNANLLVKKDTAPSRFGNFHYEIYQFKRAHDLKEHYTLQICLLSRILGQIQQCVPASTRVHLKGHFVDIPYAKHQERLERELAFGARFATARPSPKHTSRLKPPARRGAYMPTNSWPKQKIY